MKLRWDREADALYITLRETEPVSRTEQLDAGTLVDLDRFGTALGIEVLRPARSWPLEDVIARFGIDGSDATELRAVFHGKPDSDKRFPYDDLERGAAAAVA